MNIMLWLLRVLLAVAVFRTWLDVSLPAGGNGRARERIDLAGVPQFSSGSLKCWPRSD